METRQRKMASWILNMLLSAMKMMAARVAMGSCVRSPVAKRQTHACSIAKHPGDTNQLFAKRFRGGGECAWFGNSNKCCKASFIVLQGSVGCEQKGSGRARHEERRDDVVQRGLDVEEHK